MIRCFAKNKKRFVKFYSVAQKFYLYILLPKLEKQMHKSHFLVMNLLKRLISKMIFKKIEEAPDKLLRKNGERMQ